MPVSRHWTLGVPPPPPDASRAAQLRFVRDLQVRSLAVVVVLAALIFALTQSTLLIVLALVMIAMSLANLASLQFKLRREPG